jgi:hypothetical protein
MLAGFAPIAGAAVTVRVTGTDMVVVPAALKVIIPLYVPTANVPITTLTDTVPLPLPVAGEMFNQLALLLAVQLRVPPLLITLRFCAEGLPFPCCAVKDKLAGLAPIVGFCGGGVGLVADGVTNWVKPGISDIRRRICAGTWLLGLEEDGAATGAVGAATDPTSAEPVFA